MKFQCQFTRLLPFSNADQSFENVISLNKSMNNPEPLDSLRLNQLILPKEFDNYLFIFIKFYLF